MDARRYANTRFGRAQKTPGRHGYIAYIPKPIPRTLQLNPEIVGLLSKADAALGRLAGVCRVLPNPHLLASPYLRREAVASTRIEGTQATLLEFFEAEGSGEPPSPDVEEVAKYVKAMEFGISRLEELPISVRLLSELHEILLAGVRGRERQPGQIRTTQNWIGPPSATIADADFVPPPRQTEYPNCSPTWRGSPTRT
ncbi:MAG: hypothetical protein KatS3mg008_1727 [Acidimicrobiales bacterium]|nr:MAG: hypothetical protein KatS3mg008_1727 [Acidimicrobiales bacterium]